MVYLSSLLYRTIRFCVLGAVLFTIAISLFAPTGVSAKIDQRCWVKSECTQARQTMSSFFPISTEEAANGFYQSTETTIACSGEFSATSDASGNKEPIGFCLPVGQSKTTISFGGQTQFANIGVFIQFMYRYGIAVAALLAIIMIIFAGVQWVASGGNSESIKSAQHRISGAILGLLLAAASYTLLRTINPALIDLRLPSVWMVNPLSFAGEYCNQLSPQQFVGELGVLGQEHTEGEKEAKYLELQQSGGFQPVGVIKPSCGKEYLLADASSLSCRGTICPSAHVCFQSLEEKIESCHAGVVAGIIYTSDVAKKLAAEGIGYAIDTVVGDGWTWRWANEPELYAVCVDGEYEGLTDNANDPDKTGNDKNLRQEYIIYGNGAELVAMAKDKCDNNGGVKGYALSLDMNEVGLDTYDERHMIGKSGIDLGDVPCYNPVGCSLDSLIASESVIEPIAALIQPTYLLSEEDILQGVRVDVNISNICDIDTSADRNACYGKFGYTE